ncbi:hypothetical protein acdb102_28000 [Acidothermaceae bacterium B102]|nr:hypothetical protein acdb102_28000 [Acidothermaceae bacterium B102]
MFLDEPVPSESVRDMYAEHFADDGYVANFVHAWAWRPDLFTAFWDTRGLALEGSGFSAQDVALLVAATVGARGNSYCSLAWGAKLAALSDDETAARVLSGSSEGLDARGAQLVGWARRVATDPTATTQADVDALRAVGLTDQQILDATVFVAMRTAFSMVNDALGALPDAQLAVDAPDQVRRAVTFGRPTAEQLST